MLRFQILLISAVVVFMLLLTGGCAKKPARPLPTSSPLYQSYLALRKDYCESRKEMSQETANKFWLPDNPGIEPTEDEFASFPLVIEISNLLYPKIDPSFAKSYRFRIGELEELSADGAFPFVIPNAPISTYSEHAGVSQSRVQIRRLMVLAIYLCRVEGDYETTCRVLNAVYRQIEPLANGDTRREIEFAGQMLAVTNALVVCLHGLLPLERLESARILVIADTLRANVQREMIYYERLQLYEDLFQEPGSQPRFNTETIAGTRSIEKCTEALSRLAAAFQEGSMMAYEDIVNEINSAPRGDEPLFDAWRSNSFFQNLVAIVQRVDCVTTSHRLLWQRIESGDSLESLNYGCWDAEESDKREDVAANCWRKLYVSVWPAFH